jgi:hypothetical protein
MMSPFLNSLVLATIDARFEDGVGRSSLTTTEAVATAFHWEQLRAHWFQTQGDHQMAFLCWNLAVDHQDHLIRSDWHIDG